MMDYRKTLYLPKMKFSAKADPAGIETEILDFWNESGIYNHRQKINKEKHRFLIHNPPMPAYGQVCMEDALNIILKDMLVKYKLMRGFDAPNFPSWDCYTSAIELDALRLLGCKRSEVSQSELRKHCRKLSLDYIFLQKKQLQRLGIFAYWDRPVLTSNSRHKLRTIEAFGELYEAGYLQKDSGPILWCIECQNDLVEREVEYQDYDLLSLLVKFPVIRGLEEFGEDVYLVVSTNTPWTLPANTAIIIHPDYDYVAIETNEILIMAADVIENIFGKVAGKKYNIVKKMKGFELDKIIYAHPFLDRNSEVILGKQVTLGSGTGCMHATTRCNPQSASRQRSQGNLHVVDQNGLLTEEAGQFCGLNVFESINPILLELEKRGCLLSSKPVKQLYPHCSYCKKPVIVRITDKWVFNLSTNDFRQRALKIINEVNWLPDWSRNVISDDIQKRTDWGVSKRRLLGVPTPIFYCSKCNTQVSASESISASKDIIKRKGFNRWFSEKPDNILPDDVVCSRCGGRDFRWENDILDAEFVSSISFPSDNKNPWPSADICLGNDGQNEKWLQFSFLSSSAIEDSPPFKSVMIQGPIVDENGKRMTESANENLSLQEIIDSLGSDTFRLWIASIDCKKHIKISRPRLELISGVYKRVRNIFRFLLGNLSGYDPLKDRVDYKYLQEIDRWVLHKLTKLIDNATKAFESCQFHSFYSSLYHFCISDISSFYISVVKRRLYISPEWSSSRRAVQSVMYELLTVLTRLIAPIISFTAEEVWRYIPVIKEKYPSVFLSPWPTVNKDYIDDKLGDEWDHLIKIRSQVYKLLEGVRDKEGIKSFSQAYIALYVSSPDVYELLEKHIDDLGTIFGVSKVRLMPSDVTIPDGIWESEDIEGLAIEARRATGEKCERCWIYSDTVGTSEQYPTLCHRCIAILEGGSYYI